MQLRNAAVLSAVVGAVTVGFAAPAMATGTLNVLPGHAKQGQKVGVHVKECSKDGSVAKSDAFVADITLNTEGEVEGVVGLATIASQAKNGAHQVYVDCAGVSYVGQVIVGPYAPKGSPKTGLGGNNVNLPLVGVGGVLVLGAGGLGVMAVRRRRTDAQS